MPKRKQKPSLPELERSLDRIYAEISQLFSYYYWYSTLRNPVLSTIGTPDRDPRVLLVQNGIVSGHFLTLRKLHEFFEGKPANMAREGDVFASDFPGFQNVGGFLTEADFQLLHKEIGHITIPDSSGCSISGEVFRACSVAIDKVNGFLDYLENGFVSADQKPSLRKWRAFIDRSMDTYRRDTEAEQFGAGDCG